MDINIYDYDDKVRDSRDTVREISAECPTYDDEKKIFHFNVKNISPLFYPHEKYDCNWYWNNRIISGVFFKLYITVNKYLEKKINMNTFWMENKDDGAFEIVSWECKAEVVFIALMSNAIEQ